MVKFGILGQEIQAICEPSHVLLPIDYREDSNKLPDYCPNEVELLQLNHRIHRHLYQLHKESDQTFHRTEIRVF